MTCLKHPKLSTCKTGNPKRARLVHLKHFGFIRHYNVLKLFTKFHETFMNIIESYMLDQKRKQMVEHKAFSNRTQIEAPRRRR